MDNPDPHKTYSYSQDQLLMTAFDYELRNTVALRDRTNELTIIEEYLRERVTEIKERWK